MCAVQRDFEGAVLWANFSQNLYLEWEIDREGENVMLFGRVWGLFWSSFQCDLAPDAGLQNGAAGLHLVAAGGQ